MKLEEEALANEELALKVQARKIKKDTNEHEKKLE
jgi:hypothetical protein